MKNIKNLLHSLNGAFSYLYTRYEYAAVVFLVLVWQFFLIRASNGLFLETDNYTHAMRLTDLIRSGSWRETMYMHDNCPFGQILHFSRLADMSLYLTTLPFLPFLSLKQAVLFGGFLYNPFIACLSAAAIVWAGRSFFGPMTRALAVLFYFLLPFISSLFLAGRPDHHVLLNLLLIIVCGCLMYGAKTQKTAYYKTAGLFCGLAVWATPEGFLTTGFLFAGMLTAWLFRFQNMRQIRLLAQFFFITTAVCLLANPPMQGFFHPDNGRLSFLLVMMSGAAFVSFYAEELLERRKYVRSFAGRVLSLGTATLLSWGLILLIFGKKAVFSSPIAPELYDIWAMYVTELEPGYRGDIFTSDSILFLYLCIAVCIVFFFSERRIKKLLIEFGIPLLLFSLLILFSSRFVRPCSVFAAVTLPLTAYAFFSNKEIVPEIPSFCRPLFLFVLLILYAAGMFLSYTDQVKFGNRMTKPEEYLSFLSRRDGCVLTSSDRGPETAWGTDRNVIGSPYHSNVEGIIDNHAILYGQDDASVRKLLKRRRITDIILENPEAYRKIAKERFGFMNSPSFGEKLVTKRDIPCYLLPVKDMPEELNEKYLIYYVDFSKCETSSENTR